MNTAAIGAQPTTTTGAAARQKRYRAKQANGANGANGVKKAVAKRAAPGMTAKGNGAKRQKLGAKRTTPPAVLAERRAARDATIRAKELNQTGFFESLKELEKNIVGLQGNTGTWLSSIIDFAQPHPKLLTAVLAFNGKVKDLLGFIEVVHNEASTAIHGATTISPAMAAVH